MQLLENTYDEQLPMQLIESPNTSEAANSTLVRHQLTMIWVKEVKEGHQSRLPNG